MWTPVNLVNLQPVLLQLIIHWVHVEFLCDLSLKRTVSGNWNVFFKGILAKIAAWLQKTNIEPTDNKRNIKYILNAFEKHTVVIYCVCELRKKWFFGHTKGKWHETLSDAAVESSHSSPLKERGTSLNWGLTVGYWLSSEPWTPQSPHLSLAISLWGIVVVPLYGGDWPSTCRNTEQNQHT